MFANNLVCIENLETAPLLVVVGTAAVFVILLLVIYLGKPFISLVSEYAPEEQPLVKQGAKVSAPISGNIAAATTAAANVVAQGKGRVTKVERA